WRCSASTSRSTSRRSSPSTCARSPTGCGALVDEVALAVAQLVRRVALGVDDVEAGPAVDRAVAVVAPDAIVAGAAPDVVVAVARVDPIPARAAVHDVVLPGVVAGRQVVAPQDVDESAHKSPAPSCPGPRAVEA